MNARKGSNILDILPDLNAGVFLEKVNAALTDAAARCIDLGKKAQVTITIDLNQIGESNQVAITHTLQSSIPKARGKIVETDATDTPMHVSPSGEIALYPSQEQSRMDLGAGAATGRSNVGRTSA